MTVRYKSIFLYIIYIIIVGALVLSIGLAFRNQHTQTPTPVTRTHATNHPAGSSANRAGNSKLSTTAPGGSNKTSSTPTAATPSATLTNTGPGDVVGLFVATSLISAMLWRRKLMRNVIR